MPKIGLRPKNPSILVLNVKMHKSENMWVRFSLRLALGLGCIMIDTLHLGRKMPFKNTKYM